MAILLYSWEAHAWHRLVLSSSQGDLQFAHIQSTETNINKLSSAGSCKAVYINAMFLISHILDKSVTFL